MFWLIECEEQIQEFLDKKHVDIFIELIPLNNNTHPALNDLSLVYIKPLYDVKGYMICIDHTETLSLSKTHIQTLFTSVNSIYVRDKKSFLYYFPIKKCTQTQVDFNLQTSTVIHSHYYNKFGDRKDINRIIPVVKHYEACENKFKNIQITPKDEFLDKTILAFFGIERNGIKINETDFDTFYETRSKTHSIQDSTIYTQYNLLTTTRRPSNSFNGINFAALNKENGSRKSFIPKNDKFVEIDISAYHPTLAGQLVDYKFNVPDIHAAFAELYGVDYAKAKELTFKQLYGGVFDEYKHLEFFQKTTKFINDKWKTFNNDGEVIMPISGYRFDNQLPNMNPQKLFNYYLQHLETSTNVNILLKIHRLLVGKKSQIVLYTYDSFLFDIDDNEETELMGSISNIFTELNLNTKTSYGHSYDF
jgi:hypothetical protein